MPLYGERLRNRKVDVPAVRCHFVKIMLLAIPFPDLSPTLIEIPLGPITLPIRWYALAYIAGIILGVWMAGRALARPALWQNETPAMTKERLEDFTTWLIVGIILGWLLGKGLNWLALRIMGDEEQAKDVGGIIHCVSEDAPFASAALDLGFVSSFSGIVTFKKAVAVQEAALKQPADALLIETDAPYLAPIPRRGKRNEPAYVAYTAGRIAELRGVDPEALAQATYENALRIFGIRE